MSGTHARTSRQLIQRHATRHICLDPAMSLPSSAQYKNQTGTGPTHAERNFLSLSLSHSVSFARGVVASNPTPSDIRRLLPQKPARLFLIIIRTFRPHRTLANEFGGAWATLRRSARTLSLSQVSGPLRYVFCSEGWMGGIGAHNHPPTFGTHQHTPQKPARPGVVVVSSPKLCGRLACGLCAFVARKKSIQHRAHGDD